MYGTFVKEQFKPKVSDSKREEMLKSVEKTSAQNTVKRYSLPSLASASFAPKNDYLKERRVLRDHAKNSAGFSLTRLDYKDIIEDQSTPVQKRLVKLQERTKKHENKIKNYEMMYGESDLGNRRAISNSEAISNAYLDSIHAKLAFLQTLK